MADLANDSAVAGGLPSLGKVPLGGKMRNKSSASSHRSMSSRQRQSNMTSYGKNTNAAGQAYMATTKGKNGERDVESREKEQDHLKVKRARPQSGKSTGSARRLIIDCNNTQTNTSDKK